MYIILNNNKKIKNPLTKSDVFSYEGPIDGVDLHRQKRNYHLISEKLSAHNMFLDYIWFAKFNGQNKVEYHYFIQTLFFYMKPPNFSKKQKLHIKS